MQTATNSTRKIVARYSGTCVCCGIAFFAGATIYYNNGRTMREECGDRRIAALKHARENGTRIPTVEEERASHPATPNCCDLHTALTVEEKIIAQINSSAPVALAPIADGTYTVVNTDGKRRTFSLETQSDKAEFAPGKQVIALLTGSDNENDFTSVGIINEDGRLIIWRKHRNTDMAANVEIALDVIRNMSNTERESAGYAYAVISSRCRRCRRVLTVPASVNQGYGPTCIKVVGG